MRLLGLALAATFGLPATANADAEPGDRDRRPRLLVSALVEANAFSVGWTSRAGYVVPAAVGPLLRVGAWWRRLALSAEVDYLIAASYGAGAVSRQLLSGGVTVQPLLWASGARRLLIAAAVGASVGGDFASQANVSSRQLTVGVFAGVGASWFVHPQFAVDLELGGRAQLTPADGDIPGVASVYVAVGGSFATGERAPPTTPPTTTPPPPTPPVPSQNVDDNHEVKRHCQGSRLLIVIGNFDRFTSKQIVDGGKQATIDKRKEEWKDTPWMLPYADAWNPTNAAARDWALAQHRHGHTHVVAYNTSGGNDPQIDSPQIAQGDQWVPFTVEETKSGKKHTRKGTNAELIDDCCYFDEVMVMMHGKQQGGFRTLIKVLPSILGGRPVKKVVFWICESTDQLEPKSGKIVKDQYENLGFIVKPTACRCGCAVGTAHAARDPDGNPGVCPDGKTATRILASGAFAGRVVRLGLDLDPAHAGHALTSPDGRLREILVAPDGTMTASIPDATEVEVFGGIKSGANGQANPDGAKYDKAKLEKPSTVKKPDGYVEPPAPPPHSGDGNGCIPDLA